MICLVYWNCADTTAPKKKVEKMWSLFKVRKVDKERWAEGQELLGAEERIRIGSDRIVTVEERRNRRKG
jgi:hypothetical protein